MKENVTFGSHINKLKKKTKPTKVGIAQRERETQRDIFFIFFSSLTSLFNIRKSDSQNSSGQEAKCSTQQGLRLGTKNTGFSRVFN